MSSEVQTREPTKDMTLPGSTKKRKEKVNLS